jgi:Ca2+-binding RTX toxin-like protein
VNRRSKLTAAAAGLVLLGAQALALAPGAQAVTGTVVDRNLNTYTVFAQDGKVNEIVVTTVATSTGSSIVVEDPDDQVIAGNDCTQVTAHRAECVQSSGPQLIISGGDLNDTLRNLTTIPAVMQGGSGDDRIEAGNAVGGTVNILSGDAGADTLVGGTHTDRLFGGSGMDTLNGGDGNDVLDGGPDNDTLTGGPGTDVYRSSDTGVNGTDGADTMNGDGTDISTYASRTTPVNVTLDGVANDGAPGEGDNNVRIGQVIGGSGPDVLTGDAQANNLSGGPGNDVLDGGLGGDALAGNDGIDTVVYTARTTAVTVTLGGLTADDGAAGEGDLVGTDVENVTGGSGDDTITGSAGANRLLGGDGKDHLTGGDGDDVLIGDAGDDTLDGVDHVSKNDTVNGGFGAADICTFDPDDTVAGCEG